LDKPDRHRPLLEIAGVRRFAGIYARRQRLGGAETPPR
jgi:hypothetical protein